MKPTTRTEPAEPGRAPRRDSWRQWLMHAFATVLVMAALTPIADAQQPGAPLRSPEVEVRGRIDPAPTAPNTWGTSATPAPDRPSPPRPAEARLTLSAYLTQDGEQIDQGLIWRVYTETPGAEPPQPRLVATNREPAPTLALPPGSYLVNVGFGRAHLTRRVMVPEGKTADERFVLNAGGLRVTALLGPTEKMPDLAVTYDVYQGDADQLGGRTRVVGGLRPSVIVRLNAGLYHLVSTMGDANATVSADVTVEAGKLTDAVMSHNAARVTLKLVTRPGGEAQADTQWTVHTMLGDLVRETQGALPTHILSAGQYIASARHAGRLYQRQFAVVSGETAHVELVMQ